MVPEVRDSVDGDEELHDPIALRAYENIGLL